MENLVQMEFIKQANGVIVKHGELEAWGKTPEAALLALGKKMGKQLDITTADITVISAYDENGKLRGK